MSEIARKRKPAVSGKADSDVCHGELRAGNVWLSAQNLVNDCQHTPCVSVRFAYRVVVALRPRGPRQTEEGHSQRCPQGCKLPVHPTLDIRPLLRLDWKQRLVASCAGEVSDDGIWLPQHKAAVDQSRHQAIRIQSKVLVCINDPEVESRINTFVIAPLHCAQFA